MYTEHIVCREKEEIMEMIELLANGEEAEMGADEIREWVQDLYEDEKMSSTQYDEFMRYLDDLW